MDSFLIEITSKILAKRDTDVNTNEVPAKLIETDNSKFLVDMVLDKTGNKGAGKMTMKEAAESSLPVGTMSAALDVRFIASDKDTRLQMTKEFPSSGTMSKVNKNQLVKDVRYPLYANKIYSYAQGWNLIKAASKEYNWNVNLGESVLY